MGNERKAAAKQRNMRPHSSADDPAARYYFFVENEFISCEKSCFMVI